MVPAGHLSARAKRGPLRRLLGLGTRSKSGPAGTFMYERPPRAGHHSGTTQKRSLSQGTRPHGQPTSSHSCRALACWAGDCLEQVKDRGDAVGWAEGEDCDDEDGHDSCGHMGGDSIQGILLVVDRTVSLRRMLWSFEPPLSFIMRRASDALIRACHVAGASSLGQLCCQCRYGLSTGLSIAGYSESRPVQKYGNLVTGNDSY